MSIYDRHKSRPGMRLPYANPDNGLGGGNREVFKALSTTTPEELGAKVARENLPGQTVDFPRHLFVPEGSNSLDLRKAGLVTSGTVDAQLLSFRAPEGAITRFLSYGIFNDGLLESTIQFTPLVDGSRVLPYHGDPDANYRISLALSADLSYSSLIPCQINLNPGQFFQWLVTNTSVIDVVMGVRMIGYFDNSQRGNIKIGG